MDAKAPTMRLAFLVASLALAGCSVRSTSAPPDLDDTLGTEDVPWTPEKTPEKTPTKTPLEKPTPDDDVVRVVVSVHMIAKDGSSWYCTGTLVAADKVVTAAHCLDPDFFAGYEIVASLAPGKPRVTATAPKIFGGPFEDVANPDVGFLTLHEPVVLPRYAELTDVVSSVESGASITGAAVVRVTEDPRADFAESAHMPVSSTVGYGYEHGFGTPMFSKGGDSGAGLFLVEDGAITHKLIGVARQPEPDRELDHFTRIDAAFKDWYAASSATAP